MSNHLERYLSDVTAAVRNVWGGSAPHVLVGGSIALGDFQTNESDVDIAVIHPEKPTPRELSELTWQLDYEALPCPGKGLDLVGYHEHDTKGTPPYPRALYGYVTGPAWEPRLTGAEESSDFLIDLFITRTFGQPLLGSPPAQLIGAVPVQTLVPLVANVVNWHRGKIHDPFHDPTGTSAVLNACRAWYFVVTGEIASKTSAGWWALQRTPSDLVQTALDRRRGLGGGVLEGRSILAFLDDVANRIAALCEADNTT